MLGNFRDNDWKQKMKTQKQWGATGQEVPPGQAPCTRHRFPRLPHSNQTTLHAHATTPHHHPLLWPKAPFGPNQSTASALTPPSSQHLFILMAPLSPGHGIPWEAGEGEGTAMAAGSEVETIDLFVTAFQTPFPPALGHFGQGCLP